MSYDYESEDRTSKKKKNERTALYILCGDGRREMIPTGSRRGEDIVITYPDGRVERRQSVYAAKLVAKE